MDFDIRLVEESLDPALDIYVEHKWINNFPAAGQTVVIKPKEPNQSLIFSVRAIFAEAKSPIRDNRPAKVSLTHHI
jgi:hypothetical protein